MCPLSDDDMQVSNDEDDEDDEQNCVPPPLVARDLGVDVVTSRDQDFDPVTPPRLSFLDASNQIDTDMLELLRRALSLVATLSVDEIEE